MGGEWVEREGREGGGEREQKRVVHSVIERDTLEQQSIDHDGLCLDDD